MALSVPGQLQLANRRWPYQSSVQLPRCFAARNQRLQARINFPGFIIWRRFPRPGCMAEVLLSRPEKRSAPSSNLSPSLARALKEFQRQSHLLAIIVPPPSTPWPTLTLRLSFSCFLFFLFSVCALSTLHSLHQGKHKTAIPTDAFIGLFERGQPRLASSSRQSVEADHNARVFVSLI